MQTMKKKRPAIQTHRGWASPCCRKHMPSTNSNITGELVEGDHFGFGRGRIERYRTGDGGKTREAFPVSAGSHGGGTPILMPDLRRSWLGPTSPASQQNVRRTSRVYGGNYCDSGAIRRRCAIASPISTTFREIRNFGNSSFVRLTLKRPIHFRNSRYACLAAGIRIALVGDRGEVENVEASQRK